VSGARWRDARGGFYRERGGEEARASRWTAARRRTPLRLGGGLVGARFRKRKGRGWLGTVTVGCSAHWREGEADRRRASGGRRGQEGGAAPRVEDDRDRWAPPASGV
jgi:hypothetical protein